MGEFERKLHDDSIPMKVETMAAMASSQLMVDIQHGPGLLCSKLKVSAPIALFDDWALSQS